jgi:hypothetical protein
MSRNQSPKRRREPLPKVPKVPPKRAYDYTPEENAVIAKKQMEKHFAKKKPEPPLDKEKVIKMLKTLHQPEPRLSSNYDRSILKSNEAAKVRSRSSSESGKSVPQLGEQKNSCPPLQMFPDIQCYDPQMVALYKEEADAHGMSIPEYLSRCGFPTGEIAYTYRYGDPLVRSEEMPHLPTKMRRFHKWYMDAYKEGKNWIMVGIKDEHYGCGNDMINIEFLELF